MKNFLSMNNNYFFNEYGDAVGVPFDSFTKNVSGKPRNLLVPWRN